MYHISLVVVGRIFFGILLLVAGGLTYYTYDWQRFTTKTLTDVQKTQAFGIVSNAYIFVRGTESTVNDGVLSFGNTLDSIAMNVSDAYDVMQQIQTPVKDALLSDALAPGAILNLDVNYIVNDSSSPRGYLVAGCTLLTSGLPLYTTLFGCSTTNASLLTGLYPTSLYSLNPGHAPNAVVYGNNPLGAFDRTVLLNRTNLDFSAARDSGVTYMVLTYYIVDYPSATTMRIRNHFFTSNTWDAQFLMNREEPGHDHVRCAVDPTVPRWAWDAACGAPGVPAPHQHVRVGDGGHHAA